MTIASLQISTRQSGPITIVDLIGKAAIGDDNDRLHATLQRLVGEGAHNVLLNLTRLTKVDSSSIGTIAATFVDLKNQGGSLQLLCPHGSVREALGVTRLLERIPYFEDESKAIASF
jgi:anti-anti-sigma factor